jgi:hypothetical protein
LNPPFKDGLAHPSIVRAAIEFFAPDIEWSSPHPDGGAIQGRDELRSLLRRYPGTWKEFRHELEGVRVLDDQRVLTFFSEYGRGKGSGPGSA